MLGVRRLSALDSLQDLWQDVENVIEFANLRKNRQILVGR